MSNCEDSQVIIGGIEGYKLLVIFQHLMCSLIKSNYSRGGGHSVAVLFDKFGRKLVELQGPCTNHWVIDSQTCIYI